MRWSACTALALLLAPTARAATSTLEDGFESLHRGDFQSAARAARRALGADPTHEQALLLAGVSAIVADKPASASKYLTRLLRVQPASVPALVNLGSLLTAQPDLHPTLGAEECFTRALELQPHNTKASFNLAELLLQRGNRQRDSQAGTLLEAVVAAEPDHVPALVHLASLQVTSSRAQRLCLQALEHAAALPADERAPVFVKLAPLLERHGMPKKSRNLYRKALKLSPVDAENHLSFASALKQHASTIAPTSKAHAATCAEAHKHWVAAHSLPGKRASGVGKWRALSQTCRRTDTQRGQSNASRSCTETVLPSSWRLAKTVLSVERTGLAGQQLDLSRPSLRFVGDLFPSWNLSYLSQQAGDEVVPVSVLYNCNGQGGGRYSLNHLLDAANVPWLHHLLRQHGIDGVHQELPGTNPQVLLRATRSFLRVSDLVGLLQHGSSACNEQANYSYALYAGQTELAVHAPSLLQALPKLPLPTKGPPTAVNLWVSGEVRRAGNTTLPPPHVYTGLHYDGR